MINYNLFNKTGNRQLSTRMAGMTDSPFLGSVSKTTPRGRGRKLVTKSSTEPSLAQPGGSADYQTEGLGRIEQVAEEDILDLEIPDEEGEFKSMSMSEGELGSSEGEERDGETGNGASGGVDSEDEIDRELQLWKEKVKQAKTVKQVKEDKIRKEAKRNEIRRLRAEHEGIMSRIQESERQEDRFGPDELRAFKRMQDRDARQRSGLRQDACRPKTTENFFQQFGGAASRDPEVSSEVWDWEDDDEDREGEIERRQVRSGIFCKPTDKVEVREVWPHMNLVDEYPGKKKGLSFHDLDFDLFVAGELERITSRNISHVEKDGRLYLLKLLAYIHANSGWETVQSIYSAILQKVERRLLAWEQARSHFQGEVQWLVTKQCLEAKAKVRRAAGNMGKNVSKSGTKKTSGVFASQDLWWCRAYNRGTCTEASPHPGTVNNRSVQVQHFCPRCYLRDREIRNHKEGSDECQHKESQ